MGRGRAAAVACCCAKQGQDLERQGEKAIMVGAEVLAGSVRAGGGSRGQPLAAAATMPGQRPVETLTLRVNNSGNTISDSGSRYVLNAARLMI